MKLKDLINKYKWKDISSTIIRLYPDQKKSIRGYKEALTTLYKTRPSETKWSIVIKDCFDEDEKEHYANICGKFPDEQQYYALDLTDWAEWLGMKISYKTLRKYSKLDIIAHCLWEMTWYGFTQEDIDSRNEDLRKATKEIKYEN